MGACSKTRSLYIGLISSSPSFFCIYVLAQSLDHKLTETQHFSECHLSGSSHATSAGNCQVAEGIV